MTLDASTNEVWIYFQGTDNKLWKVRNDAAGSGLSNIGGNFTRSSPYVSEDGWVYFQGTDIFNDGTEEVLRGKLWSIFNDGTQQAQLGGNYTASTPKVGAIQFVGGQLSRWVYFQEALTNNLTRTLQTENPLATGTARPKFYILTVLYAPPGTTGGNNSAGTRNSLVDYGSSSATGTTTTIANSVKAGFRPHFGPDKNTGLQFDFSQNTTDSSSISIQKAETFDMKIPGPAMDGIDHDHDVFVLLLNPLLTVATFPGNNVQVAMGVDGPTMNIQYVYAGWLKGVTAMAPGSSSNSTRLVSTTRTTNRSLAPTRSSPDQQSSTPIASWPCPKASHTNRPTAPSMRRGSDLYGAESDNVHGDGDGRILGRGSV